jgi:outer membrane protein OmpA-like peptidoglycan-associated protein
MKHSSLYKSVLLAGIMAVMGCGTAGAQFLKKLKNEVKDAAQQGVEQASTTHAVNDAGNATDKTITKGENAIGNAVKGKNGDRGSGSNNVNTAANSVDAGSGVATPAANTSTNDNSAVASIESYQNYDFVPGDTVLFWDDFTEDQYGEFPSHWNLDAGQAVVNKVSEEPAFFLTEGNYCVVDPLMKTKTYLTDPFTIEFDYFPSGGSYGPILFLKYKNEAGYDDKAHVQFTVHGGVETGDFPNNFSNDNYPNESDATFLNHWHHAAIIYKNNQMKCYVDQYRILVMPNVGVVPYGFGIEGIGDPKNPIIVSNIRAASGGNMNMIGKKFTATKIVTHGITFDVDKSDIKPESMGTLNMIAGILKSNPGLKFEIDGHTDNTGDATHNMTLSQQRADAVKTQLVSMGIDASRLTTKGFGDTKPISDNGTPEGRANNRRVEFIKQ